MTATFTNGPADGLTLPITRGIRVVHLKITPTKQTMETTPTDPAPLTEANGFKIGDKVTFTRVTRCGGGFNLSVKDGKILRFSTPSGKRAEIKWKGGKSPVWVPCTEMRHEGQRNALTEAMMGKADGESSDP